MNYKGVSTVQPTRGSDTVRKYHRGVFTPRGLRAREEQCGRIGGQLHGEGCLMGAVVQ